MKRYNVADFMWCIGMQSCADGNWVGYEEALAAIEAAREEGRKEARRIAADLVRESVGENHDTESSGHVIDRLALASDIEKGHCASVNAAWVDAIIYEYRDTAESYGCDIERGEHMEECK